MTAPPRDTIHASCIAIAGRGVLLAGASGAGKSDLALRLIDRGAMLVSDDYTALECRDGRLYGSPPATIAGRIEVRGVGIVALPHLAEAEIRLHCDLDADVERMPEARSVRLAGVAVPAAAVAAFEVSAPLKIEWLLKALAA